MNDLKPGDVIDSGDHFYYMLLERTPQGSWLVYSFATCATVWLGKGVKGLVERDGSGWKKINE